MEGMPPRSRNQWDWTGADTPDSTAVSSLVRPPATFTRNPHHVPTQRTDAIAAAAATRVSRAALIASRAGDLAPSDPARNQG